MINHYASAEPRRIEKDKQKHIYFVLDVDVGMWDAIKACLLYLKTQRDGENRKR